MVRSTPTPSGQPALVIGGGSGHYPAFAGWVGPGMAHGAPCGNVFASPSASQVYSVARNAENGGGVVLGFGNYAGDVLHFGLAAEKLRADGIDTRIVRVSDDIMSNSRAQHRDRRGIAGDLPVFKITGAAIEAGSDLDDAERIAWKANDATRSFGVAFGGCTLPGADSPLFHVPSGQMAVGLGIHGEPGVRDDAIGTADEVAEMLVAGVLAEEPSRSGDGYDGRAAVIVNGLGTVTHEELLIVFARAAELLEEHGVVPIQPEIGELVTSLDMAGLSLTLVFLDEELEKYWLAAADTPGFRRSEPGPERGPRRRSIWTQGMDPVPESTDASRATAASISGVLDLFADVCAREEAELGRLDAIAGDGDHGQGMALGSRGAATAARTALDERAGARTLLARAGEAWAEAAGGTSGALWGAALTAAGNAYADTCGGDADDAVAALQAGIDAVLRLGGARVGDKTMVDAAIPFRDTLIEVFKRETLSSAILEAAATAREAADATAHISARKGRSRVLGDKSKGTPDPGALSFSILMHELGGYLS